MNAKELRKKYVEFFLSKGHLEHSSSPLVPIDATGKLDESLLFTGAGMVQFKPYFRAIAKPPSSRLVTSQKCVRAVDIEEVGNLSHLTFFEMLGNFSFGDYFKKDAIAWAWEFLTGKEWLGIEPQKICVTVFEDDDEAYTLWAKHWTDAGLDPSTKIHKLGEDFNYWPAGSFSAGPPGPCGPCSEIFFQVAPDAEMVGDYTVDEQAKRWLEIWNLVFMQFEWKGALRDPEKPHLGYAKTGMEPLPAKCIDTGSGLDRTAAAIGGFDSVYDTDIFTPIVASICELSKHKYGTNEAKDRVVRIIADHMRTACFCISDGILPANSGRGYVLRRLIRRSVLKGQRELGFDRPFLFALVFSVVEALGDPYLELSERRPVLEKTLLNEEELFRRTLHEGVGRFSELEANSEVGKFSGSDAFFLHDTFGFPLEVTKELAEEHGRVIDLEEFDQCMKAAQDRSRSAHGADDVFGQTEDLLLVTSELAKPTTEFVGYDTPACTANLVQISPRFDADGRTSGEFQICLDETPFYAESGGQVGDTGIIRSSDFLFSVTNTWKEIGIVWCDAVFQIGTLGELRTDKTNLVGLTHNEIASILQSGFFFKQVHAEIDLNRRRDITRNHTATHLLHAALRDTLGTHVTQAGSLVAPDRLRFDFTHSHGMTSEQLESVEQLVMEKIADASAICVHTDISIADARKRGAMMLFGEKYGDRVRMIEIGQFSLELCGGCHVANSAEIGMFKIISESSSASGVRRIEAMTGRGAYHLAIEREQVLKTLSSKLKSSVAELPRAVDRLQAEIKDARKQNSALLASGSKELTTAINIGAARLLKEIVSVGGAEAAKLVTDRFIESEPSGVALVALVEDGKVAFFCKVGAEAQKAGAHAGNLAKAVAQLTGGGGGGSPGFAQAGGKDKTKVESALASADDLLRAQLNGS